MTHFNSASRLPAAVRAALAAEAGGIARHPGCWPVHAPPRAAGFVPFWPAMPIPPAKPPRAARAISQGKDAARAPFLASEPAANGRAGDRSALSNCAIISRVLSSNELLPFEGSGIRTRHGGARILIMLRTARAPSAAPMLFAERAHQTNLTLSAPPARRWSCSQN